MSVELKPHSQLGFERPFTRQLTKTLAIHNPHARPVGFKIKTTAPKQYCVRPNAGRVEPGETVEVAVILQPMREDPPLDARCKDKFLVQSAIIPVEQEVKPLGELWADLERTAKASISEQKIRCTYLAASAATTGSIPENGPAEGDVTVGDASRMDESTYIQAHDTPSRAVQANGSSEASPTPVSPTSPTGDYHDSSAVEGLPASVSSSTPASASAARPANPARSSLAPIIQTTSSASGASSSAPAPAKSAAQAVQDELAAAKNEIARLTSELANGTVTGLRKRANAAGNSEAVEQARVAVHEVASTGVPVPVVAVIAFSVFLVTYLFF